MLLIPFDTVNKSLSHCLGAQMCNTDRPTRHFHQWFKKNTFWRITPNSAPFSPYFSTAHLTLHQKMRFHTITLLSCLAAASLAVPLQKRCDPSIIVSCKNFTLSSDLRTLTATCESNKGSNKESSIVINDFIGNNNGKKQQNTYKIKK